MKKRKKGMEKKRNKRRWRWILGVIFIPIGFALIGLGVDSLLGIDFLLKKCCCLSPIFSIGLGIGLVTDGIIFLKTYWYLDENEKDSLGEKYH
jgi:hypothetical protein